tara:strand:- start:17698 stop:19767 length:2070 start_codon:yes stop_codon:yes gene_type:complete
MVGYNNVWFDWPILNYVFSEIQNGGITNAQIYQRMMDLFASGNTGVHLDKFKYTIWDNKQFVQQVDLYKINHFDNKAKATSLKILEFNMGMANIIELPIPPGTVLNAEQRQTMLTYNHHDVDATTLFMQENITAMMLRDKMTWTVGMTNPQYPVNFTNFSESKMGVKYFEIMMRDAGMQIPRENPDTGLKGTYRPIIHFKDAIFDYVKFERRELQCILEYLKTISVVKTKECLNDLEVPAELAGFMNPDEVIVIGTPEEVLKSMKLRKNEKITLSKVPPGTDLSNATYIATHLHVVLDGFQFDFGTGGIHGSMKDSIIRHDPATGRIIIDVDVASYYPNLAIANQLYPAHLSSEFCKIYKKVYDIRRFEYPKKQFPLENKAIKLALNTVYGVSNDKSSIFYDPLYTMSITLNGQLLLCMLAEQLLKVPRLKLIQINTDGVTYQTDEKYRDHCAALNKWWEDLTKLELESVDYAAMYIMNVNNYIAEYTDGELKRKSSYEYNMEANSEWHKDFSARIVARAAEQALVHGIPVIQTILAEKDLSQFMLRTKVKRSDRLMFSRNGESEEIQRVSRFYAANDGGTMEKLSVPTEKQQAKWNEGIHYVHCDYPDKYVCKAPDSTAKLSGKYYVVPPNQRREIPIRSESILSDFRVQHCNSLVDSIEVQKVWDNLNLNYYITRANKLVDPLREVH